MALDPILAEILACPADKGPLFHVPDSDVLYNPRLRCTYRIDDGIPVLLVDEATHLDADGAAALDAKIAAAGSRPTGSPVADSPVADSSVADSSVADSSVADSSVADSPAADSLGMAESVDALAEQLETALSAAQGVDGLPDGADIGNVVVMGMGGSGVAGDIVSALASPLMRVPVAVVKNYECPAFVGPGTVAVAVSFSGNTAETLEAATAAHAQGASVIAVTGGGRLAELAQQWGVPLYRVDGSIPMPRCAVGAITVPVLVALERMGLLDGVETWIDAAVAQLRARRTTDANTGTTAGTSAGTTAGASAGAARQSESGAHLELLASAEFLASTVSAIGHGELLPIFYGGGQLGLAAAGRAKAQINENAKLPAYASAMPELCHNELAGWDLASGNVTCGNVTSGNMTGGNVVSGESPLAVIALRHDFEHPHIERRFEFTSRVLAEARVPVRFVEIRAAGVGPMAQLFDLIYQVDRLSLSIAAAAGRDPGPIPVLLDLKAYLSQA